MEKITQSIFPAIEVTDKPDGSWEFKTVLRKIDEKTGKWCFCNISEKANPNFPTFGFPPITKDLVIKKLVFNTYNLLICGIVDSERESDFKTFYLDDDQTPEEERIKNYLNIR